MIKPLFINLGSGFLLRREDVSRGTLKYSDLNTRIFLMDVSRGTLMKPLL